MKQKMKSIACIVLFGLTSYIQAQYTSTEIRHATGHGPYPITINIQTTCAGNKRLLQPFVHDFDSKYKSHNNTGLYGFSANAEIVIASQHFLRMFGKSGFNIEGGKLGITYHYIKRNILNDQNIRLHLQEETIGVNIGYRLNLLYPLTCELLLGPTIYNFCTVTEHQENQEGTTVVNRVRMGSGIFERDPGHKGFCSGIDSKFRLNLFDPGGTEGGLGLVFEYGRMYTFGKRDISALYREFLGTENKTKKSWDYGYFSCGLIFPLACRIISR
jgi:hypothetical protein